MYICKKYDIYHKIFFNFSPKETSLIRPRDSMVALLPTDQEAPCLNPGSAVVFFSSGEVFHCI